MEQARVAREAVRKPFELLDGKGESARCQTGRQQSIGGWWVSCNGGRKKAAWRPDQRMNLPRLLARTPGGHFIRLARKPAAAPTWP
jgi:hypothetical protein